MRLPTLHLPSWPAPPLYIFLYGDDDDTCPLLYFYRSMTMMAAVISVQILTWQYLSGFYPWRL